MVDARIDKLVRSRYTGKKVTFSDILAKTIDKVQGIDYILTRTMMRPRDVIDFFNRCISLATDSPKIDSSIVKLAEKDYSKSRIHSLEDEWSTDYPNFLAFVAILKRRPASFRLSDLTEQVCAEFCLDLAIQGLEPLGYLSKMALHVVDTHVKPCEFRDEVIEMLYKVGLVGLKLEAHTSVIWSYETSRIVVDTDLTPDTRVHIHPCAWQELGVTRKAGNLDA